MPCAGMPERSLPRLAPAGFGGEEHGETPSIGTVIPDSRTPKRGQNSQDIQGAAECCVYLVRVAGRDDERREDCPAAHG